MAGAIPLAVRRARAKELEGVSLARRRGFAASFLGKTVEVCIERASTGWTAEYLKCSLARQDLKDSPNHGKPLARRSLVRGRVVEVDGEMLIAEPPRFAAL